MAEIIDRREYFKDLMEEIQILRDLDLLVYVPTDGYHEIEDVDD